MAIDVRLGLLILGVILILLIIVLALLKCVLYSYFWPNDDLGINVKGLNKKVKFGKKV